MILIFNVVFDPIYDVSVPMIMIDLGTDNDWHDFDMNNDSMTLCKSNIHVSGCFMSYDYDD